MCGRQNVYKCAACCVCSRCCSYREYTHQNTVVINGKGFVRSVPPTHCEISVKKGYENLFNSVTCTAAYTNGYCIRLTGVAEMQGHKHEQTTPHT